MKRKKVLALTMAAAMLFGSSLSAFAATGTNENTTGETVTGTGKVDYVDTTIYSVTIPTSQSIELVVDPQGLAGLTEDAAATAEDLEAYAGKITCATTPVVTNLSSVPMKVSVKLTLTGEATGVTKVEDVDDETGKANNVLLYAVPSAVDTLGDESGYVASTTGIVLSTTAADVDFILPAAEYSFVKTVSGGDSVSGGNAVSVSYELAEDETGHGTGLAFEGYVNKFADWSAYAGQGASKSIGMTAVFTFTDNIGSAAADDGEDAPFAMVEYTGTTVKPGQEPSISDITYTQGSGALEVPYTLGSGEAAKEYISDVLLTVGEFAFSKNGTYGYDDSYGEYFDIQANKIVIDEYFMNFYQPGESQLYVVYDDDPTDYAVITVTVVAP